MWDSELHKLVMLICAFCLSTSVPVSADVSLELGECINLHLLDGQEPADSASVQMLENGSHQLVLNCSTELGWSNSDEEELETSETFVLLFEAVNVNLRLAAPEIRTTRQLEAFNREGNFQLLTEQAEPLAYEVAVLEKEGFQIFRDYRQELEAFNRTASPAAVASLTAEVPVRGASVGEGQSIKKGESPDQEIVGQMLRYWYLKADEQTRTELENWIRSRHQSVKKPNVNGVKK